MAIESFTTNIPDNTSLLQVNKFTFLIPDKPMLKYFCQTVSIPAVSTTEITIPTPFSNTYRHGEKLNYEPLTLTALVDEDLRVWQETYEWLKSLTRPESFDQYPRKSQRDTRPLYFDGHLTINTNANKPNIRIKFLNCHPTSISMINFDTKLDAETIPTFDITFRYDVFQIERLTS